MVQGGCPNMPAASGAAANTPLDAHHCTQHDQCALAGWRWGLTALSCGLPVATTLCQPGTCHLFGTCSTNNNDHVLCLPVVLVTILLDLTVITPLQQPGLH